LLRRRVWCLPRLLPTPADPFLPGLLSSSRYFFKRPRLPRPRRSTDRHPPKRMMAGKLRFAPVRDRATHRSESPSSEPGTTVRRSDRGGYRARWAGSWLPHTRSEDRGGSEPIATGRSQPERGIASGEAAEADPESHPHPNPFEGSPRVRARTAGLLLPACLEESSLQPSLSRGLCRGDLDAIEVCPELKSRGPGSRRFPAASRRSRRPSRGF
jgi:hypothetical protein